MYRRILIAADPEGLSGDAAPAVAAVSEPDAEVRIVLVWDLTLPKARRTPGEEALEHLFDEVRAHHLRARLDRRDAPEGRVGEEIAESAWEFNADLIVVGSHRRGDLYTFFRGSVGHALAAQVSTPIMVVGTGTARPAGARRILVGVDGELLASREAVAAVVTLAAPNTEVTVVHVDVPFGGMGAYAPYSEVAPNDPAGRRLLDDELAVLSATGVRAHGRQIYSVDRVGKALVEAADELDADLIVLGSRRHRGVQALLLGSVAHDVIARTQRTVLLAATDARTSARKVTHREVEIPVSEGCLSTNPS